MDATDNSTPRKGFCPVYDIECPSGQEAAESCDSRFYGDYNPLTSLRDADIEYCALYRQEQQDMIDDESKNKR